MIDQTVTAELKSLIFKYGSILIVFHLFNQFALNLIPTWTIGMLYPEGEEPISFSRLYAIILSISSILINSIVALIVLSDTRKNQFRWLIFFLTVIFPAVGVVFMFITKFITASEER